MAKLIRKVAATDVADCARLLDCDQVRGSMDAHDFADVIGVLRGRMDGMPPRPALHDGDPVSFVYHGKPVASAVVRGVAWYVPFDQEDPRDNGRWLVDCDGFDGKMYRHIDPHGITVHALTDYERELLSENIRLHNEVSEYRSGLTVALPLDADGEPLYPDSGMVETPDGRICQLMGLSADGTVSDKGERLDGKST